MNVRIPILCMLWSVAVGCATPKETMSVEEAFKPGEKAPEEATIYDLRWARQFGPSSQCEHAAFAAGPADGWKALQACSLRGDLTELDDVIQHFGPLATRPNVHAVMARVLAARGLVFAHDLPKLREAGIELLPPGAVFEMNDNDSRGKVVILAGRLNEASQTTWALDEQSRGDVDAYNWKLGSRYTYSSSYSSTNPTDARTATYKGVGKNAPTTTYLGERRQQDSTWEDTGTEVEARFLKARQTPQLGGRWVVIGRVEKRMKLNTSESARSVRVTVLAAVPLQ
ncbi:MAG: hypothetical protein JNM17_25120 [Archangium sp.]|nr:hypothetical protein [Archangium sp.]